MKLYLSIDLDYWLDLPDKNMYDFFDSVMKLDVPKKCSLYHHGLIDDINNTNNADTLFNIDCHSDLTDFLVGIDEETELTEGTWVNFVSFRENGKFVWIYPHTKCNSRSLGRCDDTKTPFGKKSKSICGWKLTSKRKGKLPTSRQMKDVVGIGISISPDWIHPHTIEWSLDFFGKRKLLTSKQKKQIKKQLKLAED